MIQRDIFLFHGNALEKDGKAIICLGGSGNGKSTLAYILSKNGWKLIADDMVAVRPDGVVLPGIPRIKLWHDAVNAFGIEIKNLRSVRKGLNKYILPKESLGCVYHPIPLEKIFRLSNFHTKKVNIHNSPEGTIRSEK